MLFDFTQSLAGSLAPPITPALKGGTPPVTLVFQLSLLPEEIIPDEYANAQSSSNPNGSYVNLYRFRELVNSVPAFMRYFSKTGYSVESMINNFLFGATVKPNNNFTQMSFMNAQQTYTSYRLANMSGIPGAWQPVYANPWNWAALLAQKNNLLEMTMDMSKPSSFGPQSYAVIGQGQNDLIWSAGDSTDGKTISPNTKIRFIRFKYMKVDIQRPWLDLELFNAKGWYLSGQESGFYSSGRTDLNNGILPMLPVSVIIGTDLEIYGKIDPSDQQFIETSLAQQKLVRLGTFPFSQTTFGQGTSESVMKSEGFFTMAWLSTLIPLAPTIDDSANT